MGHTSGSSDLGVLILCRMNIFWIFWFELLPFYINFFFWPQVFGQCLDRHFRMPNQLLQDFSTSLFFYFQLHLFWLYVHIAELTTLSYEFTAVLLIAKASSTLFVSYLPTLENVWTNSIIAFITCFCLFCTNAVFIACFAWWGLTPRLGFDFDSLPAWRYESQYYCLLVYLH